MSVAVRTALLGLAFAPSAASQITFTIMGEGRVADVSSDGTYAVGSDANGAFLWGPTGTTSLGQDDAVAVSDDGSVVFGNMTESSGDRYAGRWTSATGWVQVGALSGNSGTSYSSGYGMSNDGNIGTGLGWNGPSDGAAFLYDNGVTSMLPQLGVNSHRGNVVSGDGTWIGGWDEADTGPRRACLWDPMLNETFILEDPMLNPEGIGEVFGLSTNGTWACGVGSLNTGGPRQGFVWSQAGGVVHTGEGPPTGGFFDAGFANGVTDDGSVVVGQWGSGPFSFSGTIWTPGNGLEIFNDYLAANGVASAAGWHVQSLVAITPDGRTLVGNAQPLVGFQTSWFIVTIGDSLGTRYCTPNPNSTTATGTIAATGSIVAADNDITLIAGALPVGQFGIFVVGDLTDMVVVNSGILCVGGEIGRFQGPGQVLQVDAFGQFSLDIDLTMIPQPMSFTSATAGDTFYFQAWHRDFDAMGDDTSNFTEGLQLDFL